MRIALFTDGIHPFTLGGIQKHSAMLLKHLLLLHHYVVLVTFSENELDKRKLLKSLGLEEKYGDSLNLFLVPFPSFFKFPGHYVFESYIFSKYAYYSVNQQLNEIDFFYCQGFTGWYLLNNKERIKAHVGVNFHGLNMFQKSFGLRNKLQNWMFRPFVRLNLLKADIVFSLGGELNRILLKLGVSESKLIEQFNGVDESWLVEEAVKESRKSEITQFLFVGRNDRVKGLSAIIEVIENSSIKLELLIVGQSGQSTNKVKYLGIVKEQKQLEELYANCDALLMFSFSEGMPTVILEAMAVGKPVISTKVGAIEVLVDQNNGILIEPGDIAALKNAIEHFAQMSTIQRDRMGQNARSKIGNRFLWSNIVKESFDRIEFISSSKINMK